MSSLTSTVPGAFNALYNLLVAAGNAQNPKIPVFHSEVLAGQLTQNGYVLLRGVQNHRLDLAALGSYAHYECYEICGCVDYYQGGPDPLSMVEQVLDQTWAIYQEVVMSTVVANRGAAGGAPVLGSSAPTQLTYVLPICAEYTGAPSGDAGFAGQVEFRYEIKARITVP